jgi:hypothetical protein
MTLSTVRPCPSMRNSCLPQLGFAPHACLIGSSLCLALLGGVVASAQVVGSVDSSRQLRVGSLGVGLEGAQFDTLASDRLAYGRLAYGASAERGPSDNRSHSTPEERFAAGLPERREPRGFDPSVARPRVKPAPSAVFGASAPAGHRESLPRLRQSLPLLVQPMDEQAGGVRPAGTAPPVGTGPSLSQPALGQSFPPAPRPMVGPAVGVRLRPLTPSGR